MKNEGWTLSDLAGELLGRGIDINEVSDSELAQVLHCPNPTEAARQISNGPTMDEYLNLPESTRRYR